MTLTNRTVYIVKAPHDERAEEGDSELCDFDLCLDAPDTYKGTHIGVIFEGRERAERVAACINEHDALRDSLSWIVEFCNEHPEWFGEGNPGDGSEYEWLDNANRLLGNEVDEDA